MLIDLTNNENSFLVVSLNSENKKSLRERSSVHSVSNSKMSLSTTLPIIFIAVALSSEASACKSGATASSLPFFGNKTIHTINYNNTCSDNFVKRIKEGRDEKCVQVCTECVASQTNGTFNLDLFLGLGCSISRSEFEKIEKISSLEGHRPENLPAWKWKF